MSDATTTTTSRRVLLGFAGLAAIAAPIGGSAPATMMAVMPAQSPTPFRVAVLQLEAATARFEGLPPALEIENPQLFEVEQDRFFDAVRAVEQAPVADFREFVELFQLACDDGMSLPNDDTIMKLVVDARRLLAGVA